MLSLVGVLTATNGTAATPTLVVDKGQIIATPGWTLHGWANVKGSMDAVMDSLPAAAGRFGKDLPPQTFDGGTCPTFESRLWQAATAPVRACIGPAVLKVLEDCNKARKPDTSKPAATMSAIAACGKTLAGFSENESFAGNFAAEVSGTITGKKPAEIIMKTLACGVNSLVSAADMPEADRKRALAAIKAVQTTVLDLVSLSEIADKIAENGRNALPDLFKHDFSGHDGNKENVSLLDWAVEANKVAADPLQYGKDRLAGELKNDTTSMLADAALNSSKSADALRALARPNSWRGNAARLTAECAFREGDSLWSVRQLAAEKELAEARAAMDFYAHRTSCQLFEQNYSDVDSRTQATILFNPNTTTYYESWQQASDRYLQRIKAYAQLRSDREAFEEKRDARKKALGPFFEDISRLERDARDNARFCSGEGSVGAAISNETLRARLQELGARGVALKCSAEATKAHLTLASRVIETPQDVWEGFSREAAAELNTGAACDAERTEALLARLDVIAQASFGTTSRAVIEQCAFPIDRAAWLEDLYAARDNRAPLANVSAKLIEAAKAADRCDVDDAFAITDATLKLLGQAGECEGSSGHRAVQQALLGLREKLVLMSMRDRPAGDCREKGDENLVLVTVSGGGYIPHWAGGSYVADGQSQFVAKLKPGETPADVAEAFYDRYLEGSCKSALPRGLLNYSTPDIWQTLQVSAKRITEAERNGLGEARGFTTSDGDGPPLSRLRAKACPRGRAP